MRAPDIHAVCALAGEAETLAGSGIRVSVCGIGPERARAAAEGVLRRRRCMLLSWGVAGGLAPDMGCGALFMPREIADAHGRSWPTAARGARGALLSVGSPVISAEEKHALWRITGCDAVDMEGAAVAEVCAAWDVPFVSVRAIADPAHATLPLWLPELLDETGRPRLGRLGRCLLRERDALPLLLRARRQYRTALGTLRGAAARLATLEEAAA